MTKWLEACWQCCQSYCIWMIQLMLSWTSANHKQTGITSRLQIMACQWCQPVCNIPLLTISSFRIGNLRTAALVSTYHVVYLFDSADVHDPGQHWWFWSVSQINWLHGIGPQLSSQLKAIVCPILIHHLSLRGSLIKTRLEPIHLSAWLLLTSMYSGRTLLNQSGDRFYHETELSSKFKCEFSHNQTSPLTFERFLCRSFKQSSFIYFHIH